MINRLQNRRINWREKGQGLVEYALILILVSVTTIVSLQIVGPAIGNVYSDVDEALSSLSLAPQIQVVNCQYRPHGDHFHYQCGSDGDPDYERGRYECDQEIGTVPAELQTQFESLCSE